VKMKPTERLKEIEALAPITADEILSDFRSLPVDISEVEFSFYKDTMWLLERVKKLTEALQNLCDHCGNDWCSVCDDHSGNCELGISRKALE
jgi:hypothetical protein